MAVALNLAVLLGALAGMEGVAWWTHRYVMHGWLWSLHRSHHEPRTGRFELNDLFAVFFSLPSMALIYTGMWIWGPALYLGLGMTAYGAIYVLFHDALVHRRFRSPIPLRMMKNQVQAHRLHHVVATQHGAVSFSFLWARPVRELKVELAALQGKMGENTPANTAHPGEGRDPDHRALGEQGGGRAKAYSPSAL